jgi:hypothetical protein
MIKILLLSVFILAGEIAFCQETSNGKGSYSEAENDYKHIKKNNYKKTDRKKTSVNIQSKKVRGNNNYKQTFAKPEETEKVVVKTRKNKSRKSYKHSYGL